MNNWFTVKVKYTKQLDNGTFKRVSEQYLLSAMSFTDAEARTYEEIGSLVRGEFIIDAITKTELHDIFGFDGQESWYLVRVQYDSVDVDSEKSKKVLNKFLVSAENIDQAQKNIKESLSGLMVDYQITSITESAIQDVFPLVAVDK